MMGRMISLEGIDGSGKSTAAKALVKMLTDFGYDVINTREPGGTLIAEEIRNLILHKRDSEQIVPMTELLLFAAARAQHIETLIKPAVAAGKIVVCDRFADSTFAYQGTGRGYEKEVLALEQMVHKDFEPDYTLFFDVTLKESIQRIEKRVDISNRLDDEAKIFKVKVFEGYQTRYIKHQKRMVKINAMQPIEMVQDQVKKWVINTFINENKLQKNSVHFNEQNLQLACVMGLSGTPEQKEEARLFLTNFVTNIN